MAVYPPQQSFGSCSAAGSHVSAKIGLTGHFSEPRQAGFRKYFSVANSWGVMVTILTNTMQALFPEQRISENDPYTAGMAGGRPTNRKAPPFGERLAALRNAQGLSQADFAAKVGVTREMVNYYERRAKNPTADFVQKAAKVLGVSADELLGVKPMQPRKPGPQSKLQQKIERLRQLPETKQKLVLDLLDTVLQSEPAHTR